MTRAEADTAPQLSERENQIARLYVDGGTYKEIARALGIAPATVRTHVNSVYRKLEVTSRIGLLHRLEPQSAGRSSAEPASRLAEATASTLAAPRAHRKLLAILAADVVGYSRLMEADEGDTIARLKAIRAELIEPLVAAHRGRIVQLIGDGALVAFESVVDGVACAVAIQRAMAERNIDVPETRRIVLRIGVNLGDIMIEPDGNVLGDGVNVAARLEQRTAPGEVTISGTVYDQLQSKLDCAIEFLGEQQVKNISRPIRLYRIAIGMNRNSARSPPLPLPDKPSLAILPFENLSGEAAQEYFTDGIVEDIITAISKISGLFVIARNSSFAYKGRNADIRQVGRELGVRYVLEGSVRKAGVRVRITGQLLEAATGTHLWADRFDGTLEDVFELQDRVAEAVTGAIEPRLRRAEIERARSKPTENLDAYDLYLRALPLVLAMNQDANTEALQVLNRALALDPDYAAASALKSWCHGQRYQRAWTDDETLEQEAAESAARHALAAGQDDPTALAIAGYIVALVGRDFGAGTSALQRATVLNPNSALALGHMAVVQCLVGDYAKAISAAERSIRLSPLDPMIYLPLVALAHAHLFSGRAEPALEHARRAVEAHPGFDVSHCVVVAALVELGRLDEARHAADHLMARFPGFGLARRRRAGWRDTERREAFLAALRKAGLPE